GAFLRAGDGQLRYRASQECTLDGMDVAAVSARRLQHFQPHSVFRTAIRRWQYRQFRLRPSRQCRFAPPGSVGRKVLFLGQAALRDWRASWRDIAGERHYSPTARRYLFSLSLSFDSSAGSSAPGITLSGVERRSSSSGCGSGLRGSIWSRMAALYTKIASTVAACARSAGCKRSYVSMFE